MGKIIVEMPLELQPILKSEYASVQKQIPNGRESYIFRSRALPTQVSANFFPRYRAEHRAQCYRTLLRSGKIIRRGFMYCPNCGQQQISGEMRFCSRCGLALSGLAEWMAGGMLVRPAGETHALSPSLRRKAMRRAGKLMFFSVALFPVAILLSIASDHPAPLILAILPFFASLMWMVYSHLFIDDSAPMLNSGAQQSAFGPMPTRASLTPPTNIPDFSRQQVRTNELAQAPSVTEHTTKLLDHD